MFSMVFLEDRNHRFSDKTVILSLAKLCFQFKPVQNFVICKELSEIRVKEFLTVNPLPDMPVLGFLNWTANKYMILKKYGQMGIQLSD